MVTLFVIQGALGLVLIVGLIIFNGLRLDKAERVIEEEKALRITLGEQVRELKAENAQLRNEIAESKQAEAHPRKRTFFDIEGD